MSKFLKTNEKKSWNQEEKTDTLPIKVNNWNEFGKFIRKYGGLNKWHDIFQLMKKKESYQCTILYPMTISFKN